MRRRSSEVNPKPSLPSLVQTKHCRHCVQPINTNASTCHLCGKSQNRFLSVLDKGGVIISIAGAIASIALVWLAYLQFSETRQERVDAGKALGEAKIANKQAQQAATEIKTMMVDIADIYIDSAMDNSNEGFIGTEAYRHQKIISKRDRAEKILANAGLSSDEIGGKTGLLNGQIGIDLIIPIDIKIEHAICGQETGRERSYRDGGRISLSPELWARIVNKNGEEVLKAVIEYIQFKGLSPDDFEDEIKPLREFIATEKIPNKSGQ